MSDLEVVLAQVLFRLRVIQEVKRSTTDFPLMFVEFELIQLKVWLEREIENRKIKEAKDDN